MGTVGRPEKYRAILNQLEPHGLYTPATIANKALAMGLGNFDASRRSKLTHQRVRIAMGRKSNNHQFPDEGDGMVTLPGQAPCPGWFGWRWQNSLKSKKSASQNSWKEKGS